MRIPTSTYRLQITADFTLADALDVLPYLNELGVDWLYLSPLLTAEEGSTHGYDVTDPSSTDASKGGREGLRVLAEAAHAAGRGVMVDIVPNHLGVATPKQNPWWWDLLARGQASTHASAFDIDWPFGHGRLRVPILGDGENELDELKIDGQELTYYDHRFPIAAGTAQNPDGSAAAARLVHDRQHYELVNYRRGDNELNYRRFFAISTLAGVRVELPEVFAESHQEIGRWIADGLVDGLRVDHPDGLADPGKYLDDLTHLAGDKYVLIEKILEPGEELPAGWKCNGTTGYDALATIDRLFVDPAGESTLSRFDAELRGGAEVDWALMSAVGKRQVTDGILESEVLRLSRLVPDIIGAPDAIAAILSSFAVYRTYLPTGQADLDEALATAATWRPALTEVITQVGKRLAEIGTEFSTRFQQTSGMVMAKGVEDRVFYQWTRLTSLTEVGADPSMFALSVDDFHDQAARRQSAWPTTMTTLSTHDTKRGEDVRARINVLAEIPVEWSEAVRAWSRLNPLSDGPLANLLWQAVIGAWPISRERMQGYALKAAREAGSSTRWVDGDEVFETEMASFIDVIYDDKELHNSITAFSDRIAAAGRSNSWSAKLLQLAGPGVPDVYQGSEIAELSLADPDNRRPVDFAVAADLLRRLDAGWIPEITDHGAVKLLLTSRTLRCRRDQPGLFSGFTPLLGSGPAAAHVVAFDRGGVVAVATRIPTGLRNAGGWGATELALPDGEWRNALLGPHSRAFSGPVQLSVLLAKYPVALLIKETR